MIIFSVPLVIGLIFLALQIGAAIQRSGKVMRVVTLDDGRTKTVWVPQEEPMADTFARVKAELDEAQDEVRRKGKIQRVVTLADGTEVTVWADEAEDPKMTTATIRLQMACPEVWGRPLIVKDATAAAHPNPWTAKG